MIKKCSISVKRQRKCDINTVDVNGIATAMVMWQEKDEEEMLGLSTNEAFHAFQNVTASL